MRSTMASELTGGAIPSNFPAVTNVGQVITCKRLATSCPTRAAS